MNKAIGGGLTAKSYKKRGEHNTVKEGGGEGDENHEKKNNIENWKNINGIK